eukprot:7377448-Prymnesium_polylepis.1
MHAVGGTRHRERLRHAPDANRIDRNNQRMGCAASKAAAATSSEADLKALAGLSDLDKAKLSAALEGPAKNGKKIILAH